MSTLGIDLGFRGALALLDQDGKCRSIEDMPTSVVAVGKRRRTSYDFRALANLLLDCLRDPYLTVVCEDIYHMGFRGSLAARAAGIGWGAVRMWCADRGVPLITVAPSQWQRVVLAGRARGKGAARARAEELFPGVDLGKRNDEGRAEALLLAYYGRGLMVAK